MRFRASTLLYLILMAGCILVSITMFQEYKCLTEHSDKFIEVQMEGDDSPTKLQELFDKGKAIYKRTYVYNNVRYHTEINRKEFDDKFFICPDNPSEPYSERDIEHTNGNLAKSIGSGIAAIVFLGVSVVCILPSKTKTEETQ